MNERKPAALLEAYLEVLKQKPTDLDYQELFAIQKITGARDDDSIWAILVPLQANRHLDRRLRGEIREDFEAGKEAVGREIARSVAAGQEVIAESIASSVDMAAFNTQFRNFAVRLILGVVATTVATVLIASGAGLYLIKVSTETAAMRLESQQANFASTQIETSKSSAAQAADKIINAISSSLQNKFVVELEAAVAARTRNSLAYAEIHKDEVMALLSAEDKAPGVLKFAKSRFASDLWRMEGQYPGLAGFIAMHGPAAMRLYRANGYAPCQNVVAGTNGTSVCTIYAP